MPRRHAVATLATAALLLGSVVPDVLALTYPGAAPCNTTLQACVTGAASGDTIEIATNTPIAEFVDIDKSLTIQPAAGFAPQVDGFITGVTTISKDVTIRGMVGGFGVRGIVAAGGGSLVLNVVGNTFAGSNTPVIEVQTNAIAGTFGTVTLVATDNVLTMNGGPFSCATAVSAINTAPTTLSATMRRNRITVNDLSQCGGIEAVVGVGGGGSALIEANEIRGSNFDYGINLRHFGANPGDPTFVLNGTIVNNLVVGQSGNVGAPAGIVVSGDGNNSRIFATVVNNTVASGRLGLLVSGRPDLGATIEGTIANNVVALNTLRDITVYVEFAITNDNNLASAIDFSEFAPGPGTIIAEPQFVDVAGGDYRLRRSSPGVDAGRDSALDPAFTTDLAGAPRRAGTIDMGAYETTGPGAPIPVDAPLALVIAALAIAGLAARRLPAVPRR